METIATDFAVTGADLLRSLEVGADIAACVTAFLAGWVWIWFQMNRRNHRLRLEQYLRQEKRLNLDQGQRSLMHLVANLGLSEPEILEASFRSKLVERRTALDADGRAMLLFLEYSGDDIERRRPF